MQHLTRMWAFFISKLFASAGFLYSAHHKDATGGRLLDDPERFFVLMWTRGYPSPTNVTPILGC
jgi:hypothetical protein